MNYPVWDLPGIGPGLVVAAIAVFHVLISHIAVGGGAFLFAAELWAARQAEKESIRRWLHKYATVFLITTTVLGAVTGVGIWFSIQLASPEATSLLIHQFVFVWASEWVFFLVELTTLYLYYYGWDNSSERRQSVLAGIYFIVAWLSLFAINGILSFMLTPGGWTLENQDLLAAFFNPGFWPSLFIRTLFMAALGGIFGLAVAAYVEEEDFKNRIVLFCAKWIIPAALLLPFFIYWYSTSLPETAVKLVQGGVSGIAAGRMEIITRFLLLGLSACALLFIGTLLAALRPKLLSPLAAFILLFIAQLAIAGGEFFREMARKPFVVHGVLYSNSLWRHQADDEAFIRRPFLEKSKWRPEINRLSTEHGEWIFRLQCASCHTRSGYRALTDKTKAWTAEFGHSWLQTMDAQGVMPPFSGDAADRAALSAYLLSLNGRRVEPAEVLRKALNKDLASAGSLQDRTTNREAGQ